MSTKTNIFLTGVTGYIGGSVLDRLLEHPNVASFEFTALVRSSEKAAKLKALGVNPVVGSLQDLEILEDLASKADIVLSMVRRIKSISNFENIPMTYFYVGRL